MKKLAALLILTLAYAIAPEAEANFEVDVLCKRAGGADCAQRTAAAFARLGCAPDLESVSCIDAATHPRLDPAYANKMQGKDLCTLRSSCHEPRYGNFGQVSCGYAEGMQKQSLDLKRVDRGITLTTSVGLFRRYVTTVCRL